MINKTRPVSYMLVAGEPSGDRYAAALARELKNTDSRARCYGMGGRRMQEAGVELVVDSSELAVVGLVEVLAHYPALRRALYRLQKTLRDDPPDLLILIDYPEFNLKLAATAQRENIKVLYYISPQLWAWRTGRIHKIKKRIDHMAVVFPFEVDFYTQHNIPATYVGHPLVETAYTNLSQAQAMKHFGLTANIPVIGLFPGSRRSELKRLIPVLVSTAKKLQSHISNVQFVLPIASPSHRDNIKHQFQSAQIDIHITEENIYDVIQATDVIIAASGTVTLQIALLQKPMTVIYRLSPLTFWLMRRLIRLKHICLVNIILNKPVVKELIQNNASAEKITAEAVRLIQDASYAAAMRTELGCIRELLGEGRSAIKVSKLAYELAINRIQI